MYDINEEWENFMTYDDNISDEENDINHNLNIQDKDKFSENIELQFNSEVPKSSDIYISTKTKIAYLNQEISLNKIFWQIPVIAYAKPTNGVIKKQIKFNSVCIEELDFIKQQLALQEYYEEYVLTSINNPNGRIKFKDIRKISIGISKKDIMSYRCKRKSAFYNCFVLIFRIKIDDIFKEFHVKIFNTGKIEIPGIQKEEIFKTVLNIIIETLQPYLEDPLDYKPDTNETVLINSNFNCGFYINREVLYDILKFKYNIQSIYDPCSYPGIQCKFYYNPDVGIQNGCQISEENKHLYKDVREVSFMIFRTGSVLIVGRCDENVLFIIYEFLKIILNNEYKNICQKVSKNGDENILLNKDKKKKLRKKNITIEIVTP
jgi:hypothetical protein